MQLKRQKAVFIVSGGHCVLYAREGVLAGMLDCARGHVLLRPELQARRANPV